MDEKELTQKLHRFRVNGLSGQDLEEMHAKVEQEISQRHRLTQSSPALHHPRRRGVTGSVAAAVAGLAIVVGGVWYGVHSHSVTADPPSASKATNRPAQNSSAAPQSSVELNGIQMFSNHAGWMVGATGQLLHTTDGAKTWNNVSPVAQSQGQIKTTSVLDGKTAWVAVGTLHGQHATTVVYFTHNGGQSWTEHTFTDLAPGSSAGIYPAYLTFRSEKQGWLVTQVPDFGMGGTTPGALYETTDGGVKWHEVSRQVAKNIVSFGWIDFISKSVGFTNGAHQNMQADTGVTDGNSDRLYVTKDGGRTWQPVQINLPTSSYLSILKPTFVTAKSGVLPVVVRTQSQGDKLFTYMTSNGGKTWSEEGSQVFDSAVSGIDFISAKNGYLLSGSTLYHTVDGGISWTTSGNIPAVLHSSSATVDFEDTNTGWVYPQTVQVYHTTDGGKTWSTSPATATNGS